MAKQPKKPTSNLGRDETLSSEQLLQRCKRFKWFLEENWGLIGLELQRVRQPNDVRLALNLVPGVQWVQPFYDPPSDCLIREGTVEVDWRELSDTRRKRDEAVEDERNLFSEYNYARQKAGPAANALHGAIAQFGPVIGLSPFILVITALAKALQTEELVTNSEVLGKDYWRAAKNKQALNERLLDQEAWYAQNEIVRFVLSNRYDRTPINFAKAMSGLPQYSWITAHRKCSEIEGGSLSVSSPNYQLFMLIGANVKKIERLNLLAIEMALSEHLRKDGNQSLKFRIGPHWGYMKQAIAECQGELIKPAEIPFRIMSGFLRDILKPKTEVEIALAKLNELN